MAISTAASVYRWDDDSAPVLSGTRGSLCALLKACLVDGYGQKTGAGWSLPFQSDDGQIMVFQGSGDSNGSVLRIDEQSTDYAWVPAPQGFESMSDINTGTGPFPASGPVSSGDYSFDALTISNEDSGTARPWIIVANEVCFHLFIWPDSGSNLKTFFFGDFIKLNPSDMYNTLLGLSSGRNYLSGLNNGDWEAGIVAWRYGDTSTGPYVPTADYCEGRCITMPRAMDGIEGGIHQYRLIAGGGPCGQYGYFGRDRRTANMGETVYFARPLVPDRNFNTARGWLPGYYVPCTALPHANRSTFTHNGDEYLHITGWPGVRSSGADVEVSMAINLSNFWA